MLFDFDLKSEKLSRPIFGLEFPIEPSESYSPVLKQYWGDVVGKPVEWFCLVQKKALDLGAAFICLYFNLQEPDSVSKSSVLLRCADITSEI